MFYQDKIRLTDCGCHGQRFCPMEFLWCHNTIARRAADLCPLLKQPMGEVATLEHPDRLPSCHPRCVLYMNTIHKRYSVGYSQKELCATDKWRCTVTN